MKFWVISSSFNVIGALGDTLWRGDQPNEMGDALPTVDLGAGETVTAIAGGGYSRTCALLGNGTVKCWGCEQWRAGPGGYPEPGR